MTDNEVNNWNFSHLGAITVRKALSESVNVPAVRTVEELSEEKVKRTIHRLGITDIPEGRFCGNTITLGSCEVKALDMAFAYATIANGGIMKGMPTLEDLPSDFRKLDPVSVLKISDREGRALYEYQGPQEQQVMDPAHVYMLTHILSNDAIRWSQLTFPFPAAAKTGTSEEFRDSVLLGFTPDLVAGVWMGNADGTVMADRTFSGSGAGPMWHMFMLSAAEHLGLEGRGFQPPTNIVTRDCGEGENSERELFLKGENPRRHGFCPAPDQEPPAFPERIVEPEESDPTSTPTPTPAPDDS